LNIRRRGVATLLGDCRIEGLEIVGSYTAVVGLPLYESIGLLTGEGYQFHAKWEEGAP
jgi:predicted house-cleaning NTP pyrophosphatase (Maf/HAM1 superfamily)